MATTDFNSKYVSVTVTPVTIPTIFPVKLIMPSGVNSFSAGAQAVAGFQGVTVCGAAPVFMCNPWETNGMTDAQATQTLYTNALNPTFQRHQFKFLRQDNNAGPGHFGWVNPPNGGNSTPGMEQWAASTYGACYSSALIKLLPGNRPVIDQYIDVRFDIYNKYGPSADYAPAINVRKGYLPDKNANWCNASSADQVKNMVTNVTSPYLTTPVVNTTGDITIGGNQIKNVPAADIAKVQAGQVIVHNPCGFPASTCTTYSQIKIPAKAYVSGKSGTTINIGGGVTASATLNGTPLIIQWETSGLPQDQSFPNLGGQEGNGNWDCASYWSINFANVYANLASPLPPPAAPAGCTSSSPTISRYQVYRYEIANGLNSFGNGVTSPTGWSGNGLAGNVKAIGSGESGAPYCAAASGVSGVDTTTGGVDRRILLVPIINCYAQNIAGGNNGYAPAAAFAKYFLTQPYSYDRTYLWGEMAGLVGTGDNVVIANQVQLYR